MTITAETTVGSIATEHPLATRVFHRHGIDFCCGGGRPLREACTAQDVDVGAVLSELEQELAGAPAPDVRWDQAPLPDLLDHILERFHDPLRTELPRLEAMARKVNEVHGPKDPERFAAILGEVLALQKDLDDHMRKEERILFPAIREGEGPHVQGPVSVMEMEHETVGGVLRHLRELTNGYVAPEEACNTWRALWAGLEALERDLHEHIHLENNVLHQRALAGE